MPFRTDLVQWCVDHRQPLLTPIFQLVTFLGELDGFILVIALIYVAYDKRLAVRLAVLTLAAMSFNHVLKTLIRNPRPFIRDGSYRTKWAVAEARAADLASEYSTPSGHAMSGAAFYPYLYAVTRNRGARLAFVACALLTGVSRPYLGVHYVEDVLSGWALGLMLAVCALRYGGRIEQRWKRTRYGRQVAILVAVSVALWLATWMLSDWRTSDPPSAFVSYLGLLTGIAVAQPLEKRRVDFDPRSAGRGRALLRYGVCVGLVLGTLLILDGVFAAIASDASPLGHGLRYIRYAAAGVAGIYVAPVLFVRFGLAASHASSQAAS